MDDVDIFNRFILKVKSSSTMRLHFDQIYLLSLVQSSVNYCYVTTQYHSTHYIISNIVCICSAPNELPSSCHDKQPSTLTLTGRAIKIKSGKIDQTDEVHLLALFGAT